MTDLVAVVNVVKGMSLGVVVKVVKVTDLVEVVNAVKVTGLVVVVVVKGKNDGFCGNGKCSESDGSCG